MPKQKLQLYVPVVEDGIPIPEDPVPKSSKKINSGEMLRIAATIKPGQSVLLPRGSTTKFSDAVKSRGLSTIMRTATATGKEEMRVWVIEPESEPSSWRL